MSISNFPATRSKWSSVTVSTPEQHKVTVYLTYRSQEDPEIVLVNLNRRQIIHTHRHIIYVTLQNLLSIMAVMHLGVAPARRQQFMMTSGQLLHFLLTYFS